MNEWITHDGGECPIPWAKAGEFEVKGRNGQIVVAQAPASLRCIWDHLYDQSDVIAYRLTDGWIPIIGGKLPVEVQSGDHLRYADGAIVECLSNWCKDRRVRNDLVAVRPSEKSSTLGQQIEQAKAEYDSESPEKKQSIQIQGRDIFLELMTSAEAKKKALRDARARRIIVPPIGITAMMKIAGKAMEG